MAYNTKSFIEEAKRIHGDRYDYSKVDYERCNIKICIICPKHGEFWQTPHMHLQGQGCKKCSVSKQACNVEDFVKKAKRIHGDKYDYSKVDYMNSHTKICIICPKHREFWQTPNDHLNGKGCKKCGSESSSLLRKKTTEEFIVKAKIIHGDRYDYSKVEYKGCFEKICIICPKHGEFWQTPNSHLNGQGCPICRESKMETMVRDILVKNNINFIQEKKFDWLGLQSLDFYLPDYKLAIECQGVQHFKPVSFGSKKVNKYEMLELVKNRDKKKKELCKLNDINIIYFSTEVCANNIVKDENNLIKEIKKHDI